MIRIIWLIADRRYVANDWCPSRRPALHGGTIMRKEWLLSAGAVVLAFLGAQHHNLMMLLFAVGLGNAGMSLMTELALARNVMLGMSLLMAAAIGYQISRPNRPTAIRVTGVLSVVITLGLAGWSVLHFGL
jgi:hypothetical protein